MTLCSAPAALAKRRVTVGNYVGDLSKESATLSSTKRSLFASPGALNRRIEGASRAGDVVLADPDGNLFCVVHQVTPAPEAEP
jgi:hypothetical protein